MGRTLRRGITRLFRTWWPPRTATIPVRTRKVLRHVRRVHRIRRVPTRRGIPSQVGKIVSNSRASFEVIEAEMELLRPEERTIKVRSIDRTTLRHRCSRAVLHRRLRRTAAMPLEEVTERVRTEAMRVRAEAITRMVTPSPERTIRRVHRSRPAPRQLQPAIPVPTPAPPRTSPTNRTRPVQAQPQRKRPSTRASARSKPAKIKRPPPPTTAPPLHPRPLPLLQAPRPTTNARRSRTKHRTSTRTTNPSRTATRCS